MNGNQFRRQASARRSDQRLVQASAQHRYVSRGARRPSSRTALPCPAASGWWRLRRDPSLPKDRPPIVADDVIQRPVGAGKDRGVLLEHLADVLYGVMQIAECRGLRGRWRCRVVGDVLVHLGAHPFGRALELRCVIPCDGSVEPHALSIRPPAPVLVRSLHHQLVLPLVLVQQVYERVSGQEVR